jgi:hypothetical protein
LNAGRLRVDHGIGKHAEHLREVVVELGQRVGIVAVTDALLFGVRRVLLRHDPLRGALEQR